MYTNIYDYTFKQNNTLFSFVITDLNRTINSLQYLRKVKCEFKQLNTVNMLYSKGNEKV